MAVAIVSVLPLLMARLAVERAELRQVDAKLRLMGAAVEEANELIVIVSRDGQIRHANRAFCEAVGYDLADLMDRVARRDHRRRVAREARRSEEGHQGTGVERHDRPSPQRRLHLPGGVRDRAADERPWPGDALRADGARHYGRAPAAQPAHSQRAAVGGRTARVGRRARVEQPIAVDSWLHRTADRCGRASGAPARPRASSLRSDSRWKDRAQPSGVRAPLVFGAHRLPTSTTS